MAHRGGGGMSDLGPQYGRMTDIGEGLPATSINEYAA